MHIDVRAGPVALAATLLIGGVPSCQQGASQGDERPQGELLPAVLQHTDSACCSASEGGIDVPAGFQATVFADSLGWARHLAVSARGDVYVALRSTDGPERTTSWRSGPVRPGGIVALRDVDGDGNADLAVDVLGAAFSGGGTGVDVVGDSLFFATDTSIHVFQLPGGDLAPLGPGTTIVSGFPPQGFHGAKSLAFDRHGMFVNVGAPSNSCQVEDRVAGSPGRSPCPELTAQAGIWRYARSAAMQRHGEDGQRFATGLRNSLAIAWHPAMEALLTVQHGRDQLHATWPELFTAGDNARLPAEELHTVVENGDYGWPVCYWDPQAGRRVLMPEYGGDGRTPGDCARYPRPVVAFPAHYAPNDMVVYDGDSFPGEFGSGVFVAFHGSWNRAPTQAGYMVAFVPFAEGRLQEAWRPFATGFAGPSTPATRAEARFRPTGLAVGPEGALYVSDSAVGRVWRITWEGSPLRPRAEEGGPT